jgi:hypothetical protein
MFDHRKPQETVPIKHDAPLTEVWCVENGHRQRVYRGDTQEHIDWKMHEHRVGQKFSHRPELIEIPVSEA